MFADLIINYLPVCSDDSVTLRSLEDDPEYDSDNDTFSFLSHDNWLEDGLHTTGTSSPVEMRGSASGSRRRAGTRHDRTPR